MYGMICWEGCIQSYTHEELTSAILIDMVLNQIFICYQMIPYKQYAYFPENSV